MPPYQKIPSTGSLTIHIKQIIKATGKDFFSETTNLIKGKDKCCWNECSVNKCLKDNY